jgi:hypothetical protein
MNGRIYILNYLMTTQAQPDQMEGCDLFVYRISAAMDGCREAPREAFMASRETNNPDPGSIAEH